MKINKLKFLKFENFWLIIICIIGAFLRFYQLGKIPAGFVNDEADFGYNAFSLLKTGKDEFGHPWPIIFQSFGDGKMPVYFYLTMPSVLLFGLTEFAVRFPSAFFGSLTILLIYFLSLKITTNKKTALLSSLVLAFLPWHIHFSRAAFEANIGLFFITLATYLFLIKKPVLSAMSFSLSLFSYHAPRLFVPLWLIFLVFYYRPKINLKKYLLVFFLLTFLPWFLLTFSKTSLNRAGGITLIHQQSGIPQRLNQKITESKNQPLILVRALHNRPIEYFLDFTKRYFSHFDSDFLFFSGDPNRPRYRAPDMGQSLWLSLPFFFIGIYYLINKKYFVILAWLLLSPLPSAITFETPSAIRSLIMIAPLSITIAVGVFNFLQNFHHKLIKSGLILILSILFIYNLAHYFDAYFIHLLVHQPYEWQGGYKQMVAKVTQLMPQYEKAYITDARGTAYIYFLFYNQYDPIKWHQQAEKNLTEPDKFGYQTISQIDNLYFGHGTCPANPDFWEDKTNVPSKGVLYVCTEERHPLDLLDNKTLIKLDEISFKDGQTAFSIMAKPK